MGSAVSLGPGAGARLIGGLLPERDQLIADAYRQGASMREIARAVGMTHPGVRNILIRDGVYDASRSEPASDG